VRGSGVLREWNKVKKTNISAEFSVPVLHCDDTWGGSMSSNRRSVFCQRLLGITSRLQSIYITFQHSIRTAQ